MYLMKLLGLKDTVAKDDNSSSTYPPPNMEDNSDCSVLDLSKTSVSDIVKYDSGVQSDVS